MTRALGLLLSKEAIWNPQSVSADYDLIRHVKIFSGMFYSSPFHNLKLLDALSTEVSLNYFSI